MRSKLFRGISLQIQIIQFKNQPQPKLGDKEFSHERNEETFLRFFPLD